MNTTITFLGTGSYLPDLKRDTASCVLNNKVMFDTGSFGLKNLLENNIDPYDIEHLFLTHIHHDHFLGLPQLLFYRRMHDNEDGKNRILNLYGPVEELRDFMERLNKFLLIERYPECAPHVKIITVAAGDIIDTDDFSVETARSQHGAPGLMYRFIDKKNQKVIGITGDTGTQVKTIEHMKGVDLLIHETAMGIQKKVLKHHSTAIEAAVTAKKADAKKLALTHLRESHREKALEEAREIFRNTILVTEGQVLSVD